MGGFGYDFGAVEGKKEMTTNLEHYHRIMRDMFQPKSGIELDESIQQFQAFLQHVVTSHRYATPLLRLLPQTLTLDGWCREGTTDQTNPDLLDHIIAMSEGGLLTDEEVRRMQTTTTT
jgi:hypothetical protein